MSDDHKKIVMEIDKEVYEKIKIYSKETKQPEELVLNRIFQHSLKSFDEYYSSLKQGYIEMGKINLEISSAFTFSENEALTYIKYIEE